MSPCEIQLAIPTAVHHPNLVYLDDLSLNWVMQNQLHSLLLGKVISNAVPVLFGILLCSMPPVLVVFLCSCREPDKEPLQALKSPL